MAKDFYSKLGFEILREDLPAGKNAYLVMGLEDNMLCFYGGNNVIYQQKYFSRFPANTVPGYGVEIIIQVEDLNKYYQQVSSQIQIFEPLQLRHWGLEDFRITDPFGFYLRVTSRHNPALPPPKGTLY